MCCKAEIIGEFALLPRTKKAEDFPRTKNAPTRPAGGEDFNLPYILIDNIRENSCQTCLLAGVSYLLSCLCQFVIASFSSP